MANINLAVFLLAIIRLFFVRSVQKRADLLHKVARRRTRRLTSARRSRRLIFTRVPLAALARHEQLGLPCIYCLPNIKVPVLANYADGQSDTRQDFRLTRRTINHLVEQLRVPHNQGWAQETEVLVFLFWLGCGTSYRVVARAFDMPRSTVSDIVHRTADRILQLMRRVIRLPSRAELPLVASGFEQLAGSAAFQKVVGSIDGCHIRIKAPKEDPASYFNRKLFYSIQMQAVCDSNAKFLDIFVGYPGSVHDSRVLRNSPIYTNKTYPPEGYILLGDGGYPCIAQPITLLTPYREPLRNAVEARYNRHHAKARSVVERAFGMMKTRWRAIFLGALEVKSKFAVKIIACSAILHNMCISEGDWLEPTVEPQQDNARNQQDEQSGIRLRGQISGFLSAPTGPQMALEEHDYC
ncbi:putative nuclease HARBI1 [Oryzias latipes]|nr:putative nuclease HARBI1 [Oryzias latipes]